MSQRRTVALVAGAATFLASTVLSTIFELFSWMLYSFLSIAVVVVVAILARAVRMPVWGQLLAMLAGLLMMVTWTFPSGHELLGFLPGSHTFGHFHTLLTRAGRDIQELAVPVPERQSLDFLVAVGIGLVAIVVDVLAVGIRRPALAGLPLLAIYSVPVAIRTDSVSWIPFALGAAGYLWLLMTDHVDRVRRWGRRFTGDGQDVDFWEPSPLAAAGRRVGFAGLLVAIVVPLAVPGLPGGLLDAIVSYNGGTGNGSGGVSSLGTSINPISTLRGSLTQSQPINLFQIQTDDPDPGYLRTAVADRLTDNGFASQPPRRARPLGFGVDQPTAGHSGSLTYHRYHATIRSQQLDDRYLPLFGSPTAVRAPATARWQYAPETGVVFAGQPATQGTSWQVSYDSFDYRPAQLRAAPPLNPGNPAVRNNLRIRHIEAIDNQVARLTRGESNEYDRVRAILDFFSPSHGFKYSLKTKPGTSGSAIVDFLTNRQGYCEQYASAMTWMVRAAHIPARVVVGYTHGVRLGNSDIYQVTSHEAHAWVEVYFPTFGWVPFDPTPAGDVTGSASFDWAPNPAAPSGSSAFNGGQQGKPRDPAGNGAAGRAQHGGPAMTRAQGATHRIPEHWPYWLLGIAVVLALLSVPAARRGALRHRRGRTQRRATSVPGSAKPGPSGTGPDVAVDVDGGDPAGHSGARRAAHAAWDELMDTLVDYRLDVADAETPRGTAERLVTGLPADTAGSVRLLADAEERARYARQPSGPVGLRAASRQVRDGLSARVSRRRRIGALLMPRSVLLRWRSGLVGGVIGTIARFGHWRERLLRAVTPRRRPSTARFDRS